MVAVYTPYIGDRKHLLHELRNCRTFAYPDVMAKAADEIERLQSEIERLRTLLAEIRKWMDADLMGPWDAKFTAEIDAALAED